MVPRERVQQWWDVFFPEWVEKERERQALLCELAGLVPSTFCFSVRVHCCVHSFRRAEEGACLLLQEFEAESMRIVLTSLRSDRRTGTCDISF